MKVYYAIVFDKPFAQDGWLVKVIAPFNSISEATDFINKHKKDNWTSCSIDACHNPGTW